MGVLSRAGNLTTRPSMAPSAFTQSLDGAVARPVRTAPILLTLSLGVLVAQVDTSVVNLAMQQIGAAFHASVAALQWVLDAYNLAYAVLLLTGGLVADVYGRKLGFITG